MIPSSAAAHAPEPIFETPGRKPNPPRPLEAVGDDIEPFFRVPPPAEVRPDLGVSGSGGSVYVRGEVAVECGRVPPLEDVANALGSFASCTLAGSIGGDEIAGLLTDEEEERVPTTLA